MCLHLPMPQYTKVEEYLARWGGVSVHTAAKMLVQLGYGYDVMDWMNPEKCPAAFVNSTEFENMRAYDVGIFRFMGGPPGKRRLLRGTMLMLLVDRLLYNEAATELIQLAGC